MTIEINVIDQKLKIASNKKDIVAGTQEFVQFAFNLGSDWNGLTVFAQFIQNGTAYNKYLDSSYCCYLPPEIVAGTCKLLIYGTGNTTRATTNYLEFTVISNGMIADASSTQVTQDLYDQLVNMVTGGSQSQTLSSIVEELEAEIDTKADASTVTALETQFNNLINSSSFVSQVEDAVETKIEDMVEAGDLAAMSLGNGTVGKEKLAVGVQSTLETADDIADEVEAARTITINGTSTASADLKESLGAVLAGAEAYADAKDTQFLNTVNTNLSNLKGEYTGTLEDLDDDIGDIESAINTAKSFAVRGTTYNYDSLQASIAGSVTIAENYVDAALLNHEAFGIEIVDELPTGSDIETNTFYLIPKDGGKYDKWWRINNPTTTDGVTTDHWQWDNFGSTSTVVVTTLPTVGESDVDYILNTSDGCMYYKYINNAWTLVAGSLSITATTLPTTGNPNADYYIGNATDGYVHYRYINDTWEAVGSDLTTDLNNVSGRVTSLEGNQTTMLSSISSMNSSIQELQNEEGDEYDIAYDTETNQLTLTKNDETQTTVTITGGSGGGGSSSASTLTVEKITSSPLVVTPSDTVNLSYSYSSVDDDNESIDGSYVWKKDGSIIASGNCSQGTNTFDATDYCVVGTQKFTLIVTDDAGSSTSKSWSVQKVDVRIESSFNDAITYPYGSAVTFTYTPYGAISKTVHFILDGTELSSVTTSVSGSLQSYSISAQTHGSHLLEVFMTATINNQVIETSHIYKDIMFYNESATAPVIGCTLKNSYYHVVSDPANAYLDYYYVLDDDDGFITAPYKTVTTPTAANLASYYKLVDGAYVSAATDANIIVGQTYYTKEIDSSTTYYSHYVFFSQYDTNAIQYYVNSPSTSRPTVTWKIDDTTVSTQTLEQASDVWSYNSSTTGLHTLTITCGTTTATISAYIVPIDIDISAVTAGLAFDFNPTGLSNSSASRLWSDSTNSSVALTVSSNFDWSNGGYQTDDDGNTYFCVKAGTTATISHQLFSTDPKTYGKEFKVIFKTENVRNADTPFLSCMDGYTVAAHYDATTDTTPVTGTTYYTKSGDVYTAFSGSTFDADTTYYVYVAATPRNVGFKMDPHAAYLYTSASSTSNQQTYLYAPYCEEDKIEFEWNINTLGDESGATAVVMSYEDGVGLRPLIYDASHRFTHTTPTNITIGCADCDVHIYRMKAYNNALTDSNILTNFIADAATGAEMLSRYNRNQIYDANGNLTPEALAEACPDLRIIKIECPQFTNNKSNFVKYTNVQCIYKNGDATLDNWTFTNCYHSGQGTTSNEYGYAGRNIDIICCMDGVNQYSSKITFDADYKTTLTLGDGSHYYNGTGKVSLSRTSVPNNWFNIKVNIASSENANNALMQKRFDTYLPYTPTADTRNPYIKNDMEFYNCVVFVKETGNANGTTVSRREFTDSEWHFYAIGNIGDSKKTDATRVVNPDDMREFVIEVSDNTLPNANFNTGVYCANPSTASRTDANGVATEGGDYYADSSINYTGTGTMVYPITASQWANANNAKRINLAYSFDGDDTDDYAASFEFRYDLGGETRDGDTTGLSSSEQDAQRELNKTVFREFYKWVITASNDDFASQLSHWCVQDSLLYWYLFTERYTMIDNRTKNTFWHFGNIGTYSAVTSPTVADIGLYYEKTTTTSSILANSETTYAKTTDTAITSGKTYYILSGGFRSVINPIADLLGYYYEYDSTNEVYRPTSDTSVNASKTYYWTYAFEMYDYDNDTSLGIFGC